MRYNNETYWKELHGCFNGSLKAVGWPTLSESFNEAKYLSETESFLQALESCPLASRSPLRLLEIGIGIGFWTSLLIERLSKLDFHVTGLDISKDALAVVRARFPDVELEQADLRSINPNRFLHRFDLVTALMVLLHLTVPAEFDNALRFAARSVQRGGTLLLYEPAITEAYSPWIAGTMTEGNSQARRLDAYDQPLAQEGLQRVAILPGASWVLNSPIEAGNEFNFRLRRTIWRGLSRTAFRFDRPSKLITPMMLRIDAVLKDGTGAGSGKFLVYRRLEAPF